MTIELSKRIQRVKPSPTLAVSAKAKQMKAAGKDVISFSAGEPDFSTPESICNAAIKAIEDRKTRYTPASGIPELRTAVVEKLKRENELEYQASDIVISVGAKHSLYNIIQSLINDGDEVIIAQPYWVSYPAMIQLAGGVPKIIDTIASGYKVTPEQLVTAVTGQTKAFIFNNPSNPTGVVYSQQEIEALAKVCIENNIIVISDEIYEHLIYDGLNHYSIAQCPEMQERTIVVNGVSKSYAMTGWRIGYMAGPTNIAAAVGKLQSQSTSNPTSIAQYGALEALTGDQAFIKEWRDEFSRRRDILCERLSALDSVKCIKPQGAFYMFVDMSALLTRAYQGETIKTTLRLAELLLEKILIAVVPGEAFGAPGFIRFSYAVSADVINTGIDRLAGFIKELS